MSRNFLAVAVSLCLAAFAANAQAQGTTCKVSLAQYESLTTGMSYAEARKILGCDGIELSSSEMGDFKAIIYVWSGSGGFGANMNAMFQNDELITKNQIGLR